MLIRTRNRNLIQVWLAVTSFLFLFLALLLALFTPAYFSKGWILVCMVISFLILIVHLSGRYLLGDRDVLSFDKLFLVALLIFHFGYVLPFSLGEVSYSSQIIWSGDLLTKSVMLVLLGLAAFVAGYNLRSDPNQALKPPGPLKFKNSGVRIEAWFTAGRLAIWVGGILIAIFVYQFGLGNLLHRNYGFSIFFSGDYATRTFTGGKLLIETGFPIFFFEVITRKRLSPPVLITGAVAIAYFILLVTFGVRSWILTGMVIPLLLTYHYHHRRITLKLSAFFLILLLLLSVVVERGRSTNDRTIRGLIDQFSQSYRVEGFSLWELTSRTGVVITNVVREMSFIPKSQDYAYGKSYLGEVLSSIPFLGGPITSSWYESPDRWLTRLTNPWAYHHNEGIGFSMIAEAHLNFGVFGVIIALFLVGYIGRWLYLWLHRTLSVSMWFLYVLITSNILFALRQSASMVFRPVWGLLLVWLVALFFEIFLFKTASNLSQNMNRLGENDPQKC